MRLLPIGVAFVISQSAVGAPLADARWARLAHNLFPAIEAIEPSRLSIAAKAMLVERRARIAACGDDPRCAVGAAKWSDGERALLVHAAETAIGRGTGRYHAPDDGIAAEVDRQIVGLNDILDVYGLGAAPRYPAIDGPGEVLSADAQPSSKLPPHLSYALDLANAGGADAITRLDPSIGLAIALLDGADRDEATAFEPLDEKFNAAPAARARSLDWSRYRFTAIIVPGNGPDDPDMPLSAGGKLRIRLAAERYTDGLAPFILVSGSSVHPRNTRFVEALEMRSALIERFNIPESAIVIEPYARHTTTNLRNATRRLVAIGAPLDRDALIVTDKVQSAMIESQKFSARNQKELGYQPGRIGGRLSQYELIFRPSASSLRVDPTDPLDP